MPTGFDASLPLQSDDTAGFYTLSQTIRENTHQKIKMLLMTAPGERMMIPKYGVGLRRFLFEEPAGVEIAVINRIREQMGIFMKNVKIVSLEVKSNPNAPARVGQKQTLSLTMTYLIKGVNLIDSIQLVETQLS